MVDYKCTNALSSTDEAYIAALIDGEGTISLSRRHRHDNRQLVVSISNTEKPLLDYVCKVVGTGKLTKKKTYKQHHTPSLTYSISNRQALDLLQQIVPYLKTYKLERAKLILKDYLRVTPRNGKYSDNLLKEREIFIERFFDILP